MFNKQENMSNKDFLHQILHLRRQCLEKIDEENHLFNHFHNELEQWKEKFIENLNDFIEIKFEEIKQKTQNIHQEQLRSLDRLYSNYLSDNNNNNNHLNNKQLLEDIQRANLLPIQISYPKQIDLNEYLQINFIDTKKTPRINLSTYQLISSLPIHSNITSLFTTDDRLLIYYDYESGSASLQVFDLKSSLEQINSNHQLKFSIPYKHFHGKIMHMEYCPYFEGFLLSTSSKFYLLQIPNSCTTYQINEYYDLIGENFLGVLQKFLCHRNQSNLVYLLINSPSDHILIQIDLSLDFSIQKKWTYPQNNLIASIKTINDFALENEHLLFALTYQINDHLSYELHLRSMDMSLQHRFLLHSSFSPRHICFIPSNDHQQFLLISHKSKILSLYDITNDRIESIDDIHLASEPEYIDFVDRNSTLFLLRNSFHIAIYQQSNLNESSILLDQRLNIK